MWKAVVLEVPKFGYWFELMRGDRLILSIEWMLWNLMDDKNPEVLTYTKIMSNLNPMKPRDCWPIFGTHMTDSPVFKLIKLVFFGILKAMAAKRARWAMAAWGTWSSTQRSRPSCPSLPARPTSPEDFQLGDVFGWISWCPMSQPVSNIAFFIWTAVLAVHQVHQIYFLSVCSQGYEGFNP